MRDKSSNDTKPRRPGRTLVALAVICSALVVAAALMAAPASGISPGGRIFKVLKGESASVLASRLQTEGIIRSALAFRLAARTGGLESSLKAGTFRLESGMGLGAVLSMIASGKQATVRVTIPEGYTIGMTAKLLEESGIVHAAEFVADARDSVLVRELGIPGDSLEGYLSPDTYFFPVGSSAREIARLMVDTFRSKLSGIAGASAMSPEGLHRIVILASIIEREYRAADEAPLMASVFNNRLKSGMRLQSCATVVYIITEKQGKPHPEVVYTRDLGIRDPYNTYLVGGLPPGPISNPGMTALNAVFFPAKTGYYYFRLTDPASGRHHFSRTLDEHIEAQSLSVKQLVR